VRNHRVRDIRARQRQAVLDLRNRLGLDQMAMRQQ